MALNNEWKDTGKSLGGAFANLGKTLIKTAKVGVDKAEAWADDKDPEKAVPEENVTNDGTWRETGKELGSAFAKLGKTLFNTADATVDKAEEWATGEKPVETVMAETPEAPIEAKPEAPAEEKPEAENPEA